MVNSLFGLLDKQFKWVLIGIATFVAYRFLKPTPDKEEELAEQAVKAAVESHETALATPPPAPKNASPAQVSAANRAKKLHRSAVLAEKLWNMMNTLHYNGPGRDFSELDKQAFEVALSRLPLSVLEKDYRAVNGKGYDLRTDLRREYGSSNTAKYLAFIKRATMPYEEAAKLFNSLYKKKK
jgi:hypothetical protein